jgi:hypothetical protein
MLICYVEHAESDDDSYHDTADGPHTEKNDNESDNGDAHNEFVQAGSDSDVVDITSNIDNSTKTDTEASHMQSTTHSKNKSNLSWIEMSEQGKLAVPVAKLPLQFETTRSTELPLRLKHSRKQANIGSFLTKRGSTTTFVNLVEDGEDAGNAVSEVPRKKEKERGKKSDEKANPRYEIKQHRRSWLIITTGKRKGVAMDLLLFHNSCLMVCPMNYPISFAHLHR